VHPDGIELSKSVTGAVFTESLLVVKQRSKSGDVVPQITCATIERETC
jgi:hypothetical protein